MPTLLAGLLPGAFGEMDFTQRLRGLNRRREEACG